MAARLAAPGRVVPAAPLEAPPLGLLRRPDLAVLPAPVACPLLVVEVVAPHFLESDHRTRARDYAAMGVPTYLLVDPRKGTGVLHTYAG
ncbi:Uma2 family endonuclease [Kitasatospora phosalacinea]|uniref:Uma2 family endonuclease n=1 Tax=Kitasatospora phosalacinea TaxID=2065 RepID=UPI0036BED3FB